MKRLLKVRNYKNYPPIAEVKKHYTSPLSYNLILLESDVSYLQDDNYYFAPVCQEIYDDNFAYKFAVAVGNNVYGNNHNKTLMYQQALINYFAENNSILITNNEKYETIKLMSDIISNFCSIKEGLYLEKINGTASLLDDLGNQIQNLTHTLNNFKYTGGSIDDFYTLVDKFTKSLNDAEFKYAGLSEYFNKNTQIVIKLKNVDKALTTISRGFYVGDAIVSATQDAITINTYITTMQDNKRVLELVRDRSTDAALSQAASDLLFAIESQGNLVSYTIVNIFEQCKYNIADGETRMAISQAIPYGVPIIAGIALSDLTLNVSDTSENIIHIYAMATLSDILNKEFSFFLSPYKQSTYNEYRSIYAFYGRSSSIPFAISSYNNLAIARIQGERNVVACMDVNSFVKNYLKILGIDTEGAAESSNSIITTIISKLDIYNRLQF